MISSGSAVYRGRSFRRDDPALGRSTAADETAGVASLDTRARTKRSIGANVQRAPPLTDERQARHATRDENISPTPTAM
jgi:hypothetical protein